MEQNRHRIFLYLLLTATLALSVFSNGCAYITGQTIGESTTIIGSMPRWAWTMDDRGYSIIVERQTNQPIGDVTPEEAFGIIGTSERLNYPVVIDVRTPQEYAQGHIRDAINIDYSSSDFKDEINELDKNKLYVVYCHSGRRSSAARDIMEALGFKYVINVTGGFSEWVAAGLPVAE
jgi:rhodanese-related sulfurtransferase